MRGQTNRRKGNRSLAVIPAREGLYLSDDSERAIANRLSRLEGQVRGVRSMLEKHESCDDILVQISALKQAINAVAVELLQAHMENCVLPQIEAGAFEGGQALESLKGALSKVLRHG